MGRIKFSVLLPSMKDRIQVKKIIDLFNGKLLSVTDEEKDDKCRFNTEKFDGGICNPDVDVYL